MKNKKFLSFVLLSGTVLSVAASPSFAQSADAVKADEGEIIVTATKRAENIQDVPLSVTAISGEAMEKQNINSLSDLQKYVPGLRLAQSNLARNSGVYLRGVGQNGTNQGIEPSVGVFIDGVYMPIPGPLQSNLRDISSVEVLRGPQGTLYGRNTPVGAININTRAPQQEFEGSATASYGNYNDVNLSGYLGGGIGKNLAARVSGWYSNRDGYEYNIYTKDRINDQKQFGVRARIKWDPTEAVTVNLIGYYTKIKSYCCAPEILDYSTVATPGFLADSAALGTPVLTQVTGDHVVEERETGRDNMRVSGTSATVDWDLGGIGTLTSITAYSKIRNENPRSPYAGVSRFTLVDQGQTVYRRGWTQELRVASPGKQAIDYIVGLYYLNEKVDGLSVLEMGPGANRQFAPGLKLSVGDRYDSYYDQKTESVAGFGQLTLNVSEKLHLIGGLRFTHDKKNANSRTILTPTTSAAFRAIINPGSIRTGLKNSEDRWTYSLTGKYDITDDVMAYVTYGTGSKSGGFNGSPVNATIPIEFQPEKSDTIEVGIKSTFLNGDLVLNLGAYRMNVRDIQSATVNPNGSGFVVGNAGNRRAQGVEMDIVAKPSEKLTLRGSFAYLDAKYTSYPAGSCPNVNPGIPAGPRPGSCDFSGYRPFHSPPVTASIAADYRTPLGANGLLGVVGADLTYTGKANTVETLDPRGIIPAYALLAARLGVESEDGRWRVSAFGRNLTNHVYYTATTVFVLNAVMSAGGFSAPGGFVGWYAPPRTYGIEASYKF